MSVHTDGSRVKGVNVDTPTPTRTEKPSEVQIENLIETHTEKPAITSPPAPEPQNQPPKRRTIWNLLGILFGGFLALAIIGILGFLLARSNSEVNTQSTSLVQATKTIVAQATTIKSQTTALAQAWDDVQSQKRRANEAQATAQVQEAQLLSIPPIFNSVLIAGPLSGSMAHNPNDTLITLECAGVEVGDFIATVRFTNPSNYADHAFDFGLRFRSNFRVFFVGSIVAIAHGSQGSLDAKPYPNINLQNGGTNTLTIIVKGNAVIVQVNDLPSKALVPTDTDELGNGDVCIGTGFLKDTEIMGKSTKYSDFKVWELLD